MSKRKQTGVAPENPVTRSGNDSCKSNSVRKNKEAESIANCMCPNCGKRNIRKSGESCMMTICPKCGSQMMKA